MSIEVTELSELSAEDVAQRRLQLVALWSELDPLADVRQGAIHDLVLHPEAVMAEKRAVEMDRLSRSYSLLSAVADPELADPDIVDIAAANHGITRQAGDNAVGEITIVVSKLSPVTVAAGTVWEAAGQQFITEAAYTGVINESLAISDNARVLNPLNNGTYSFTIPVAASDVGTAGLVAKGTLFIPQIRPINFVSAFAAGDFSGGRDGDSNETILGRTAEGIACRAYSGRTAMNAALREQEAFAGVVATSLVGMGDAEMLRDQHSIFPGSMGGRTDWYVRTQEKVLNLGLTKDATLIDKQPNGSATWQVGITRDDFPGFYDVLSILPEGTENATSLNILSTTRNMSLAALDDGGLIPDIDTAMEATYSRFQSAIVQFETQADEFSVDDLAEGDEAEFDLTLRGMPLISEIQDWASSRAVQNLAGDVLIKAPIPCFVSVSCTIQLPAGQEEPVIGDIQADIAQLINNFGFTGRLPASAVADVIHNWLTGAAHIDFVDLLGVIHRPDGTLRQIRTSEVLVIPDASDLLATPRTVAFFSDPNDIAISIQTISAE